MITYMDPRVSRRPRRLDKLARTRRSRVADLLGSTLGWHAHRPLVAQMCDRVIMRGIEECVHVEVNRVITERVGKRHREVL